jgi:hypothetical protein
MNSGSGESEVERDFGNGSGSQDRVLKAVEVRVNPRTKTSVAALNQSAGDEVIDPAPEFKLGSFTQGSAAKK